jgi:hypothetical protein
MFYSVPLTITADAIIFLRGGHQLHALIPFEGVAQCDALKMLMKFATAKLRICAYQVNRFLP